jgi:hypothetical protein
VFAQWQSEYAEHGVVTVPCDASSKKPLVSNPDKFGRRASAEIASKFQDAIGIGFFAGPINGITDLDIDTTDERVLADAFGRYGHTPLVIRSASNHFHAYYRHNGELRSVRPYGNGTPIDILGKGLIIAPPSISTKGPYEIIQGSLDDLDCLPIMRGLEERLYGRHHEGPRPLARADWSAMRNGDGRNFKLWKQLMREAPYCDSYEQMLDRARTLNENFGEPMEVSEVIKCATSAWGKTNQGENWFGRGNYGSRLSAVEVDQLVSDPYTLTLLNWLKAHHGPNNTFMVADGLVHEHLKGWPRRQLSQSRRKLMDMGYLTVVRANSQRGPALYCWGPARFKHGLSAPALQPLRQGERCIS